MPLPDGVTVGAEECDGCKTSGPCASFAAIDGGCGYLNLCAECIETKVLPPLHAYVTPTEPDFEIKS